MINKIKENIEKSSFSDKEKLLLINYAEKLHLNNLPVFFDENQLNKFFNINEALDSFVDDSIKFYKVLKKNKVENRTIYIPNIHLNKIQKWILENILERYSISPYTYSFVKNRSAVDHANRHVSREESWLLSMDIKNFFPSIKRRDVTKIFRGLGYSDEVSNYLSKLSCYRGELVQGFPTSPIISNIFLGEFDLYIASICSNKNIEYSRYADDLAFSGKYEDNSLEFLNDLIKEVNLYLNKIGLEINPKKTKFFDQFSPKKLTGIMLTNNGLKVPLRIKKKISKELYYCEKYGVESHLRRTNKIGLANYKGYMYGIVGYIKLVEPTLGEEYIERMKNIYWG